MQRARAGVDVADRERHQLMDEVEIVDHQVENDADVGAAACPGAHAPAGNVERDFAAVEQAGAGEDETLLMADRQDAAGIACKRDERIGFFEAGRDRLFDKNVGTGIEEGPHDRGVRHRRRADADEIDMAEQFAPVGDGAYTMICQRCLANFGARIGDGDQFDAVDAAILRSVVAAERAGADHCRLKRTVVANSLGGQKRISPEIQIHKCRQRTGRRLIKCFVLLHIGPLIG